MFKLALVALVASTSALRMNAGNETAAAAPAPATAAPAAAPKAAKPEPLPEAKVGGFTPIQTAAAPPDGSKPRFGEPYYVQLTSDQLSQAVKTTDHPKFEKEVTAGAPAEEFPRFGTPYLTHLKEPNSIMEALEHKLAPKYNFNDPKK